MSYSSIHRINGVAAGTTNAEDFNDTSLAAKAATNPQLKWDLSIAWGVLNSGVYTGGAATSEQGYFDQVIRDSNAVLANRPMPMSATYQWHSTPQRSDPAPKAPTAPVAIQIISGP